MKKLIMYAVILLAAMACKNSAAPEKVAESKAATDNPYTLKEPYKDWQIGDQNNAIMVLKMIKAWETKNVAECVSYFADSVDVSLDKFHEKLSRDSLTAFFEGSYTDYNNIQIEMQDWESVISADKKHEWVTLWYKQKWSDKEGKADSVNCINEAKIKEGKIIIFDEYLQHFPAPSKK